VEGWKIRLREEHAYIYTNCEKLLSFMDSDEFRLLPESDKADLREQSEVMKKYEQILWRRVQLAGA